MKEDEDQTDSIIKYIGGRVLRNNKNFLCFLIGQTGSGKSWGGVALCEMYSKQFDIPFDPHLHVVSSLKEVLELINNKEVYKTIQYGTPILFDEPQVEANARNWQEESNKMLSTLISTFRNQRLVVFFATPFMEMVDKQSRILFHGRFEVLGYDKNTKITTLKPRFIEWSPTGGKFYNKMLQIEYKVPGKTKLKRIKLNKWHINKASKASLDVYEAKKKAFSDDLNAKLMKKVQNKERKEDPEQKYKEYQRIKEIYMADGENYDKVFTEFPHMSLFSIQKYFLFIKKSLRSAIVQ